MAAATAAGLLARADLDKLLAALRADGRRVIGPTIRDGAVVHDDLSEVADLPVGRRATQAPGTYRLEVAGDGVFDYGPAAASWKPYVYPARLAQSEAVRGPDGELTFSALPVDAPPIALLGIRPCELAGSMSSPQPSRRDRHRTSTRRGSGREAPGRSGDTS